MRFWPAEPGPTLNPTITFAPKHYPGWIVALERSRIFIRYSSESVVEVGFEEIAAAGPGSYRQPYAPVLGMEVNRYRNGLMLHLRENGAQLPDGRILVDGKRWLIEWAGLEPSVQSALEYLPVTPVEESIIDAPPGELAQEVVSTSLAVPSAVLGLMVLTGCAFLWTCDDRAAAAHAAELTLQRRGAEVIERQGGSGIQWTRANWRADNRRQPCYPFHAQRLGRREEGSYCEGLQERYVVWSADRVAR